MNKVYYHFKFVISLSSQIACGDVFTFMLSVVKHKRSEFIFGDLLVPKYNTVIVKRS